MFFFMTLLMLINASFASVSDLCGNTNSKSNVTSPLAQNRANEWCISGVCENNGKVFKRDKCVKQLSDGEEPYENGIALSYDEEHRDEKSLTMKSYAQNYHLYPDDSCYQECRPEKKSFLGISTGTRLGAQKDECVRCMIKLNPSKEAFASFEVKGHGVTVYEGQKCYYACRLPAGPYLDHRPYSSECLTCIGAMGLKPELEHLMNQAGECFEIREDFQGASKVPEKFCKESFNKYMTHYEKSSKYSVDYIVMKRPQTCYEVDGKSDGKIYRKKVDMSLCDGKSINDSERSATKDRPSSQAKKSSSGGAQRN